MQVDHTAVDPSVEQEAVDDNDTAAADSANYGIKNASNTYPMEPGPSPR